MASVTGSAPDDDHTNTAVTDHPYVSMDDEAGLLVLDTAEGEVDLMDMTSELEKILDLTNTLSTLPPVTIIDPLECRMIQQQEAESLQAIFDSDIVPLNDDFTCFTVYIKYLSDEIRSEDAIRIWFSLPPNYPGVPPILEIESNESGTFTYDDSDDLYDVLLKESINRVGDIMVYDLITIAQEQLEKVLHQYRQRMEDRTKNDEERRKQIELEDALKSKKGFIPTMMWGEMSIDQDQSKRDDENQDDDHQDDDPYTYHNYVGFHRSSNHAHPRQFIGPVSNLIKVLPPTLEITRIENIIRQDLAERFSRCREEMVQSLWKKERGNPMLYSLTPQIAFHGTLRKSLPSIVQHGLVIPGERNSITVRCGSSLGKGIYLSPNADFSLGYTDSYRLVVCAALLGMKCSNRLPCGRFFTIISDSGYEWVFFNAAQILPCYVIQVRVKNNKTPLNISAVPPPLVNIVNSASDQDNDSTKKDKLQARARKYLPFGFGPGKTVILEAGEIDDDEEDYGDYQLLRQTASENPHEHWLGDNKTELQEYRKLPNDMPL